LEFEMIVVHCHGDEMPAQVGSADVTFVPEGLEVHYYTRQNEALYTAYATYLCTRLDDLPAPVSRIKSGKRILNRVLDPHSPRIQAICGQVVPDRWRHRVVRDIAPGTRLCTDTTGRLCREESGCHSCDGLLARYQGRGVLVLLTCRGANGTHLEWLMSPGPVPTDGKMSAATKAFLVLMRGERRVHTILVDLAALADAEGNFVLYRRMLPHYQTLSTEVAAREYEDDVVSLWRDLRTRMRKVDTWGKHFARAGREVRVDMLLSLSEQERRFAAETFPEVRKVLALGPVARQVAADVARRAGGFPLVVHYLTEPAVVRPRIWTPDAGGADPELAEVFSSVCERLADFASARHSHRLRIWLSLGAEEQVALRELAWRTDLEEIGIRTLGGVKRWLTKLRKAQDTFATARALPAIGHLALLWHLRKGEWGAWAALCGGDDALRRAERLVGDVAAGIQDGDDRVCAKIWDGLAHEGRVMLADLVPGLDDWLRSPDRIDAQVEAAFSAHGDPGVLAYFAEPGQEWRDEVELNRNAAVAKDRAHRWLTAYERTPSAQRWVELCTVDDERRRILLMVSHAARGTRAFAEITRHELGVLARTGTPAELRARWERVLGWYEDVRVRAGGKRRPDFLRRELTSFTADRVMLAERGVTTWQDPVSAPPGRVTRLRANIGTIVNGISSTVLHAFVRTGSGEGVNGRRTGAVDLAELIRGELAREPGATAGAGTGTSGHPPH
jgi:hypothetical protein